MIISNNKCKQSRVLSDDTILLFFRYYLLETVLVLSAKSVTKRDNPVKGKLIRRQKFTFQYLKKAIFVSKCEGHSLMDFFVRELLKKFLEMSFLRN